MRRRGQLPRAHLFLTTEAPFNGEKLELESDFIRRHTSIIHLFKVFDTSLALVYLLNQVRQLRIQ
jgi:hypothetical protein